MTCDVAGERDRKLNIPNGCNMRSEARNIIIEVEVKDAAQARCGRSDAEGGQCRGATGLSGWLGVLAGRPLIGTFRACQRH